MKNSKTYPDEVYRWHWGAFLMCPQWVLANNCSLFIQVLAWLPATNVLAMFYVAVFGYRIVWKQGDFTNPKDLIESQKLWLRFALILIGVVAFAMLTGLFLGTVLSLA